MSLSLFKFGICPITEKVVISAIWVITVVITFCLRKKKFLITVKLCHYVNQFEGKKINSEKQIYDSLN